jgi:prevent-host-death family protein
MMSQFVSLYDAKTRLSALVDRAAAGEEVVIAKNGVPCARLVPIEQRGEPRKPATSMQISYIAADFDDPDPRIDALFSRDPM